MILFFLLELHLKPKSKLITSRFPLKHYSNCIYFWRKCSLWQIKTMINHHRILLNAYGIRN